MNTPKSIFLGISLVLSLSVQVSKAILNTKPNLNSGSQYQTLQTGTFYLNHNRPLWILQDENMQTPFSRKAPLFKPLKEKVKGKENYDHIKPIYVRNRQNARLPANGKFRNFRTKAQKRITFYNTRNHLKLPDNYIPLRDNEGRWNSYLQHSTIQLPKFDGVPGEESYEKSTPLFVYTGQKGRMLFNTMMSGYQYPMREPIPGQTLFPPRTLMFKSRPEIKPKLQQDSEEFQPIVAENHNSPQTFNVTMIPFYAYEAIDPRFLNIPIRPTIPMTAESTPKPKRLKKSKKYKAYFAPEDILAQPYRHTTTTSVPLTLEKPLDNHKPLNELEPSTSSTPHKKLEVTYNDGEEKFHITYEDDVNSAVNLERPPDFSTSASDLHSTAVAQSDPWPYGNYEFSQDFHTQPLYNRRITKDDDKELEIQRNSTEDGIYKQENESAAPKEDAVSDSNKNKENTWFILNSRYKGPLKSTSKNLHSSKYVQTTRSLNNYMDILKTTTESTALVEKLKLQPQMRALYGDKLEIVL